MAGELRGWKEIGSYLGVTDRTAQRWELESNLPVHRFRQRASSSVYACPVELDRWRLSADGERAKAGQAAPDWTSEAHEPPEGQPTTSEDGAGTAPVPLRRRRTLLVASAGAAVLVLAGVFFLVTRTGAPPSKPASAVNHGPSEALDAHTSADSPFVITVRITADDGTRFVARSVNGETIFVTPRSRVKYGLLPSQQPASVRVTIYEATRGGKGIKVLQAVTLERGKPLLFTRTGDSFRLEWVQSEPAPKKEVARAGEVRQLCGMECAKITVEAFQVSSECGSCCDPDFTACSQAARRRP